MAKIDAIREQREKQAKEREARAKCKHPHRSDLGGGKTACVDCGAVLEAPPKGGKK